MPTSTPSKRDLSEQIQRLRCHQTVLVDFARVAAESSDLQRLLDIACQHAARATGVAHTKVMQYRSDKADLLVIAGKGWKPGVVGHQRLGIDMLSPPGRAYQTRETVTIADLTKDRNFRHSDFLRAHGIMSLLNAPIAVDGVVWGVVEVDSEDPDAFDEDDEKFLTAFALILALSIRDKLIHQQRDRSTEDLNRRLSQSEMMMREQNHRMRNYFQIILSILAARSRRATSDEVRSEYTEVMERVSAVGLAHDLLTVRSGHSIVDGAVYLDALCSGIERTIDELRIERDIESLDLRPDRAVPLGLVLNELVTNAIKHAVRRRPDTFVRVQFRVNSDTEEAALTVSDNGPGMGEPRPGSMGLRLVRSLATQLSGHIDIVSSTSGTSVTLVFPLVE
ncbi:MAG: sensor histidine kinase [Gemmatimonas sp.]